MMKDNFSTQANLYAQYRPTYPQALYDFIAENVNHTNSAWDCATGNGQVAVELAKSFTQVYATDISSQQLSKAPQKDNITYKVERAEETTFAPQSLDLITVAQAIHWFNFEAFFAEVKRVLKPDGLFIAVGYSLMKINERIDPIVQYFYQDIIGSYWDAERKHIDDNYTTIPFPFREIETPAMSISLQWNFEQFMGYLETWSSVQHYIKAHQENPIDLVLADLKKAWGSEDLMNIRFPLIIKAGLIG